MILELKIKNFLSFKNEVTFSFEATAEKTHKEHFVFKQPDGIEILKMAMVYGANASGKSNLVNAFDFLREIIVDLPENADSGTGFIPFRFSNLKDQPGQLELTFYTEGIKHKYVISIDENAILEESLFFYPGTQPALIYSRHFDDEIDISTIEFGAKIKVSDKAHEEIQLKTLRNKSVIAAKTQVNISIPELDRVIKWFKSRFLDTINPYSDLTAFSDELLKKDNEVKNHILKFLREADFNISDVSFEEIIKNIPDELLKMVDSSPLPDEEKKRIRLEKNIKIEEKSFVHRILNNGLEESYNLPESRESQGTLRYYGLSAPFYYAIKKNAIMIIDEIGSALHPLLVIHFIKEFLQNANESQLLFTTHNMSLLNEKDILRKDAIWFTDKKEDGSTDLYSMADFNFRKNLSFYNAYKIGKFGGIPNLS